MNKSHGPDDISRKKIKRDREVKNGLEKNLPRSKPMSKALNKKKRNRNNGCEDN